MINFEKYLRSRSNEKEKKKSNVVDSEKEVHDKVKEYFDKN